jgi:plastocyanin
MRSGAITFIVVAGLVCWALPALAADGAAQGPTITASNYAYEPTTLTIAPGQTVTFANVQGPHNFAFADGPQLPPDPVEPTDPAWDAPPQRRFDTPGSYAFQCEFHPTQMNGVITVQAPGSPTPTPTPPPGNPPPPPPPPPSGDTPVEVRTLRVDGATFCTRRGPRCRRPGVRVRIDLSRAAAVTGTLSRRAPRAARSRRFGTVRLGTVAAGPRTLRFTRTATGRRLKPGRYTLALTVADGDFRRTLRFRVR